VPLLPTSLLKPPPMSRGLVMVLVFSVGFGSSMARAGQGTFVRARPPGPPPGTHSRLGRSLARWVREAREAGLDDESMESLLRVALRAADAANSESEETA
jgi:hypothetical protein